LYQINPKDFFFNINDLIPKIKHLNPKINIKPKTSNPSTPKPL